VTFFGLIFTPLFYVLIRGWTEKMDERRAARKAALKAQRPALEEH